ncbi:hypothetical protein [Actinomadura atramentaria]|uniref:hypothetical protein n=1 Tax=Actinomadura atramentaria TaxID=1990 RepID=UPI0003A7A0D1|nr:hypothetical protein [Actinomadura atramentaria]
MELAAELRRQRELAAARRDDELETARADASHGRARADVAAEIDLAELDRAERSEDAQARTELARLYRTARAQGERIRIGSQMARSGEARALRLEKTRVLNLKVLIPVLIGFAAWSTAGVQHGAARLMDVDQSAPVWWALWLLEPVLIGLVAWVIIVRARLAQSGGTLDHGGEVIAIASLTTSIALNLIAGAPNGSDQSVTAIVGAMVAHAIGPCGAAVTAHLIGLVDRSVAAADPWTDERGRAVPLLAEMDLRLPAAPTAALHPAPQAASERASERASEDAAERPETAWPIPRGERTALPIVPADAPAEPASDTASEPASVGAPEAVRGALAWGERWALPQIVRETARERGSERSRTGADQARKQGSEARPKVRPNRGARVPESARATASEPSSRSLTDVQLRERLDALIERGDLPADPSVRAVQNALGLRFERAKRVMSLTTAADPQRYLAVVGGDR